MYIHHLRFNSKLLLGSQYEYFHILSYLYIKFTKTIKYCPKVNDATKNCM